MYIVFVFFFKQKTAYEMRISDWSSDVCSSDLRVERSIVRMEVRHQRIDAGELGPLPRRQLCHCLACRGVRNLDLERQAPFVGDTQHQQPDSVGDRKAHRAQRGGGRSEEHTSELQSLMRISYAVFCLKKKKKPQY